MMLAEVAWGPTRRRWWTIEGAVMDALARGVALDAIRISEDGGETWVNIVDWYGGRAIYTRAMEGMARAWEGGRRRAER